MTDPTELEVIRFQAKERAEERYMDALNDIEEDYHIKRERWLKDHKNKKYNIWLQFNGLKSRITHEELTSLDVIESLKGIYPNKIFNMTWEDHKLKISGRMGIYLIWIEEVSG